MNVIYIIYHFINYQYNYKWTFIRIFCIFGLLPNSFHIYSKQPKLYFNRFITFLSVQLLTFYLYLYHSLPNKYYILQFISIKVIHLWMLDVY